MGAGTGSAPGPRGKLQEVIDTTGRGKMFPVGGEERVVIPRTDYSKISDADLLARAHQRYHYGDPRVSKPVSPLADELASRYERLLAVWNRTLPDPLQQQ